MQISITFSAPTEEAEPYLLRVGAETQKIFEILLKLFAVTKNYV